jgi:hypothetical protein
MNTQVLVILAIVVVVVVVVVVWYTSQHSGSRHPWSPIGPTEPIYYIKSKANGQYLQWRTGVWVLTPHPEDGDRVVQRTFGHGNLQIVYDHPSGKVLLPPNPLVKGEHRVVLGDFAPNDALNYDPGTQNLKFGLGGDPTLVLAGNAGANPFIYTTGYQDQQWIMEAVPH